MTAQRVCAVAVLVFAALAAPAQAAAPGWSTPHTASAFSVGTYAAGDDGQGVQLFGTGGAGSRTAQLRAIKSDATQGTAVGVNAGARGMDAPSLSVNDNGQLVAAWTLDTQQPGPIGLAATLGRRTSLPKTATVLQTDGQSVQDVSTAIDGLGTGVVAWIQSPATVKTATLRSGQAARVVTLSQRAGASLAYVSVGIDDSGKPIVTWSVSPTGGGPSLVGSARGDGTGAFAPAVEQQVAAAPVSAQQTFVTKSGQLLAFWTEGSSSQAVKTAAAAPGAALAGTRTLISGKIGRGAPHFAANASGRAAVIFPAAAGKGTTLRVLLRSSSGSWGSAHTLGGSGRYVTQAEIGVDGKGRVVALWDDGNVGGGQATRVLAARTTSSTATLSSYSAVPQRSGDVRCDRPALIVSSSGDGLGAWQCTSSSKGDPDQPRLARLTAP